ncbi:hypothetical protein DY000_02021079 [Brassica cretica]|uniref:Uncharacterized protein n=1 Tax=Brassica cretica TaxID=69181 RepID=A0ABQ7EHC4_BRACR|nr:hypothetical protein DY000_02021079 [Brassica cretica]
MIMMLANIVIFRILCCFNHIAYSTQAQGRREKNCHFRIAAVLSDIEAESNRGTTQQSAAPSILTEKTSYFLAEPAGYAASQTPTPVPEDTAYCPNQAYPTTAATAPVSAPVQQAAAAAPPLTTTLTTESICVAGG